MSSAALRALRRFERAVREDEMKGSMLPDDWGTVQREYEKAYANLKKYLVGNKHD